ncbi:MAG: glycosyltransferase [Bdellovibrionales bacterium]|nr:glycosyltransferase [Bdellovibrionales bacterium]
MAFTHARNVIYREAGHAVTVLSFGAQEAYLWDDLSVLPEGDFTAAQLSQFDVLVFHAPNLRNHLRFMLKNGAAIRAKVIIGHGHEFIDAANQSGQPYAFQLNFKMRLKLKALALYDWLKVRVWAWYFRSQKDSRLALVFVSEWLRKNVEQCLRLKLDDYVNVSVINNPIHPAFQESTYDPNSPKLADFVTLRSFDLPKYAVDVVVELARRNPQWTFHVYGTGKYFDFNPPPSNLTVIKKKFRQVEMPELFNQYRVGLLPTRWDSQGVVMCEMACLGMPTVVSDIPICKLMVGEFENVSYINNEDPRLPALPTVTLSRTELKRKFGAQQTVYKELGIFEHVAREGRVDRSSLASRFVSLVLGITNRVVSFTRKLSTQ